MTPQASYSEIRKAVFSVPLWQLIAGFVGGVVFWALVGPKAGVSAFYGGSIGFAGSLVFAFVVFGFGEQNNQQLMRKIFRAEAFKLLTVGLMFYVALKILVLPFLPVLVGFMVTLIIFFVALLIKFK